MGKLSRFDSSAPTYSHYSGQRREPIVVGRQSYAFVCCVCKQPGVGGSPNVKTHQACRKERIKREAERFKEKRKKLL